ncbi:hypothetical protein [uncultured Gemmiger sp.]|mgnify:CR=1 FL=1|uniref:hypothetical protein n=1 Tax=uncultured Gemmiger sp. TaxID=1623490 RepID=UPI0025E31383|nr:hypothetical protein [uncultured Gemmiger sp.]
MKKLTLTAALLAALALTACGNKPAETAPTPGIDAPATMPEEGMEIDPEFSVDPEEPTRPEPDAELSGLIDSIYAVHPVDVMMLETTAVDLTDADWYPYQTGLDADQATKVDAAVLSEPGVGSQAYSMVLVRVKDKADTQEIADAMLDGINMRKWVCVAANKARVVTFDDKVLFVMADSELVDVDALIDDAATALNVTFAYDMSKESTEDSDIDLPDELLSAPAVAG